MAEIINLNKVRKERAKAAKASLAARNRLIYGRPKEVKSLIEKQTAMVTSQLDGHRLDDPDKA